jgi:hypothetical protein
MAFKEQIDTLPIGTAFVSEYSDYMSLPSYWVGVKTEEKRIVWVDSDHPDFAKNASMYYTQDWNYSNYSMQMNVVIHVFDQDKPPIKMCSCDLYSVLLISGCQCGGS